MARRFAGLYAAASLAALVALTQAASAQPMAPPGYDVVSRNDGGLELHFHNMPLKAVHADDSQNALALDFQAPIDSAGLERLSADFPDWISVAYASYDTGVIRANRPVTFLTRSEADGFSLRIVPRGPAPPPGPLGLRGQIDGPPPMEPVYQSAPPPPAGGHYDAYGAIRNYDAMELALHRGDPVWAKAYQRAAQQSDSEVDFGTEYHAYHSGDQVIASQAHGKLSLGGGLSLIGSVYDTDVAGPQVRAQDGTFSTNVKSNVIGGAGGFAFDAWNDTEASLEALQQNNITGGRFKLYTGDPDGWWLANVTYHQADMDTPEAVLNRGDKDEVLLGTGQRIGYGLWGSLAGRIDNYGVHTASKTVETAGWDGNLRWATDLGGVLAGLSYDGHGEYIWDDVNFTGSAPSPFIPLSIRNMETHAITASLSSLLWGDTLWFDLYGGYVKDRYASDGALYGLGLRYHPTDGVDLALGARHSTVSLMQGETGAETSAGLTFTLGFNGIPLNGYF